MKTKTNFFKLFFCFIAFAILSVIFAFAPTLTTFAAESEQLIESYVYTFSMTKMPDRTIDISTGAEFLIPLVSDNATWTSYKIKVTDPAGQVHEYDPSADNSENDYFVAPTTASASEYIKVNSTVAGDYDIYYVLTGAIGTVTSNAYTVTIENTTYEIDFSIFNEENVDTGLDALIPSQVKVGQSYTLPAGYIKETDSEVVENTTTATLVVTNSNGDEVVLQDNVLPTTEEETYTVEYSYAGGTNKPTVSYTINVVSEADYEAPEETIVVTPTFPSFELGDKEIKLPTLTVNEKYSNSTTNNVKYNIKSITIKKEGSDTIKQVLSNNDLTFDMTTSAFGVENYADLVGNYTVTYEIETAYTTVTRNYRITNVNYVSSPEVYMAYNYTDANNVDTNYAYDLKSTYGYNEIVLPAIYATDKVSSSEDLLVIRYLQRNSDNRIFYVDNKVIDGGEIVDVDEAYLESHPTVSANKAETLTGANNAQLFRFAVEPIASDYEGGETSEEYKQAMAEYIETCQDSAGEYTLYYQVYSKVSKKTNYVYSSGTTRYTITIDDDAVYHVDDESTPTISFNNFTNRSIKPSEEFTISVNASDEQDTRLKTAMFYFYGTDVADITTKITGAIAEIEGDSVNTTGRTSNILDSAEFATKLGYTRLKATEGKTNTFDFSLEGTTDYEGQSNITVVAIAINDFGNIDVVTKTLSLRDTQEDNIAPTASIIDAGSFTVSGSSLTLNNINQFDSINLPTITFADDIDNSLSVSVMYYVQSNGKVINYKYPSNYVLTGNSANGGTITATEAGTYYVIYTATDDAGNTTTLFMNFVAEENSDPIFEVEAVGEDITNTGNTVSAEQGSVINFYPTVYSSDRTSDITATYENDITVSVNNNGKRYEPTGDDLYSYKFYEVGNYVFTFTLNREGKDSLTQVVYVNVTEAELKWDNEFSISSTATAGSTIDLGYPTASQGDEKAEISVTVKAPSKDPVNATYVNNNWTYTVPSTGDNINGTYTVTYTAKTSSSTISMTKTFRVGDLQAPSIALLVSDDKLKEDIVYNGSNISYSIKVVKTPANERKVVITVTNGDKQLYSYEILNSSTGLSDNNATQSRLWNNLSVVLSSANGTVASEKDGDITTYTITGTGEYTLTISTYDGETESSSNKATKTLTFNVKSESTVDEKDDTVVGVVLIVISLLVLAGVILFFAFTGKGGKSKKSTSKREKSTKVESKSEEVEEVSENKEDKTPDEAKTGEIEE